MPTPLLPTDWFMTSRSGNHTKSKLTALLNFIEENLGTTNHEVADIAARDALTADDLSIGDRLKVIDASADATVTAGWAVYIYYGPGNFSKVAEEESMDVVINPTNLSYVASSSDGTVSNTNGTGFTIPACDTGARAGLMVPAQRVKVDHLTVTADINLDNLAAASHAAATTAGTATDNPIVIGGTTGQEFSFNIEALNELT